jgi:hypothetical protein
MSPWFRSVRFWKFFAEYYPASYVSFHFRDPLGPDRVRSHQGTGRQVPCLHQCLFKFRAVRRSATSRLIGLTYLAITLMVCPCLSCAYILSLNAHLSPGIISM